MGVIKYMIINIKQGINDSKQEYLDTIEKFESMGFVIFDIGCYDEKNNLSEATLIKNTVS